MVAQRSQILITAEDQTGAALASVQRNVATMASSLKAANLLVQGFLAGHLFNQVKEFTQSLIDARVQIDRMKMSFTAAVGANKMAEELSFVRREAERLGLPILETADAYAKMAASAQGTALEGAKTRDMFKAIAEASAVFNMSAADTEGVLRAVQQMMAKGKVQAEELRGQLGDRLPGAFQIAARAAGVTTAEFDKMMADGKVMSDEFLPKFAAELRKAFGAQAQGDIKSMQAEVTRLANAWVDYKRIVSEGPIGDLIAAGVSKATEAFRGLSYEMETTLRLRARFGKDAENLQGPAFPGWKSFMGAPQSAADPNWRRTAQIEEAARLDAAAMRNAERAAENFADITLGGWGDRETGRAKGVQAMRDRQRLAGEEMKKYADKFRTDAQKMADEIKEAQRLANEAGADPGPLIANIKAKYEKGPTGKTDFQKWLTAITDEAKSAGDQVAELRDKISAFYEGDEGKIRQRIERLTDRRDALSVVGGNDKEATAAVAKLDERIAQEKERLELIREETRLTEQKARYEEAIAEQKRVIDTAQGKVDSVKAEVEALELENRTRGMTKSEIENITIARLEERLAIESTVDGNAELAKRLAEEIRLRERLRDQLGIKEHFDDLDKEAEALKTLKDQAHDFGLTMSSSFEQAVLSGKGLREMLDGLIKDMLQFALRTAVTKPLGEWVGNTVLGLFGGGGVENLGGSTGDVGQLYSSPEALSVPSSMRRADGGATRKGSIYSVVERGQPEIFSDRSGTYLISPNDGFVTPMKGSAAGGGGGGLTIVQHNTIGAGASMAQVTAAMVAAKNQAISEIAQSMNRNGIFRR